MSRHQNGATLQRHVLAVLRSQGGLALAGMGERGASFDMVLMVRRPLQIRGVSRIPPQSGRA